MSTTSVTHGQQAVADAEWQARVELAACYRIFAWLGWTELIYNHITLRLPGPEKHFLINPFGLHYSEVKASNLVKIDLAGNVLSGSEWPVNPAGFTVHAAIHEGIEAAHCVMHTHTTAGMAVACSSGGLSMSNFYAAQLLDKVSYHDFEGITVHADEGPRLLRSIAGRPAGIAEPIRRRCTDDALQFAPQFGAGRDVFDALTRMVERSDPSFRT